MRPERFFLKTSLSIHIEYDYITAGELGNLLVRLQAVLRALTPQRGRPRDVAFVVSSAETRYSFDWVVTVAILSGLANIPRAYLDWEPVVLETFRRFRAAAHMVLTGQLSSDLEAKAANLSRRELEVVATPSIVSVQASRHFLEELPYDTRRKLHDFLEALTAPTNTAVIREPEGTLTIRPGRPNRTSR